MAQGQLMLFTKVCVTPEALEVMGRQGMTLENLLTLPKARLEDLHEWGIYIDIVKLANGELELYVGSGTDNKHGLEARWGVYGRAKSTGYSAQEGFGLHLEHALRPGSTTNLRLIAILPPRSHRALAILLEDILMIFLRSINRHKAQQVSIRNTQSMSTFVLSHNAMNIAATWKGLNGACALGQGFRGPFGFKNCSTRGEGFGDTHPTRCLSQFSYATTEVLGFHPRCLLEYRHALLNDNPVLHDPQQKCDTCLTDGRTCDGGSPCGTCKGRGVAGRCFKAVDGVMPRMCRTCLLREKVGNSDQCRHCKHLWPRIRQHCDYYAQKTGQVIDITRESNLALKAAMMETLCKWMLEQQPPPKQFVSGASKGALERYRKMVRLSYQDRHLFLLDDSQRVKLWYLGRKITLAINKLRIGSYGLTYDHLERALRFDGFDWEMAKKIGEDAMAKAGTRCGSKRIQRHARKKAMDRDHL